MFQYCHQNYLCISYLPHTFSVTSSFLLIPNSISTLGGFINFGDSYWVPAVKIYLTYLPSNMCQIFSAPLLVSIITSSNKSLPLLLVPSTTDITFWLWVPSHSDSSSPNPCFQISNKHCLRSHCPLDHLLSSTTLLSSLFPIPFL